MVCLSFHSIYLGRMHFLYVLLLVVFWQHVCSASQLSLVNRLPLSYSFTYFRLNYLTPGSVYTIAGSGNSYYADGQGSNARFRSPAGVAFDSTGIVYVADTSNHVILSISPSGACNSRTMGRGNHNACTVIF